MATPSGKYIYMNKQHSSVLLVLVLLLTASCSTNSNQPWTKAIPKDTPLTIIPTENAQLDSTLTANYGLLSGVTSDSLNLLSKIDSTLSSPIKLHAILLRPGNNQKLSAVWITQPPEDAINTLADTYFRDFVQNTYEFGDQTIQRLHIGTRIFYASKISDLLLLSESNLGVEEAIRAYNNDSPQIDLANLSLQPNQLLLNPPALDTGLRQLIQVKYQPAVEGALSGTSPTLIDLQQTDEEFQFEGHILLSEDQSEGALTKAITGSNATIKLDKYISSDAAGFGLYRQPPLKELPGELPDTTQADSILLQKEALYSSIAAKVGNRFGLALYAQSGFMTEGEVLYLRELSDVDGFRSILSKLEDQELISQVDNKLDKTNRPDFVDNEEEEEAVDDVNVNKTTYFIQSQIIGRLLEGSLNTVSGFYLEILDDVALFSARRMLVDRAIADNKRRRTMYYDQQFRQRKGSLPDKVSSLFITTNDFKSYIDPFIIPESYAPALLAKFEFLSIYTTLNEEKGSLYLQASSHAPKKKVKPTESSGPTLSEESSSGRQP